MKVGSEIFTLAAVLVAGAPAVALFHGGTGLHGGRRYGQSELATRVA